MSEDVLGRNFFTRLVELRRETFAKEDLTQAVVEETYNAIDVEWQNWTNTYLNSLRFIAEPKSGEIPVRRPGLVVSTVLGAILGGLLGVLLALSTTWWRHNRRRLHRCAARVRPHSPADGPVPGFRAADFPDAPNPAPYSWCKKQAPARGRPSRR